MKEPDMTNDVMKKIEQKQIRIKPRWYFTLTTSLGVVAVLSTIAAIIYTVRLISIKFFIDFSNLPRYGARQQLELLIASFPWWALIAMCTSIIALVWVIKKQGNLYSFKTNRIVMALAILILIIGLVFSQINVNYGHQNQQRGKSGNSSIQ